MIAHKVNGRLVAVLICLALPASAADERQIIRSNQPAERWEDAFVAGNGLMGVMEFGTPDRLRWVTNCHKFVRPNGAPIPIPDMSDQVEPMRDRMLGGDVGGGWMQYCKVLQERAGINGMIWTQGFHPGYEIVLSREGAGEVTDYRRQVDCPAGVVTTTWNDELGSWKLETFASRADDVIVTRLESTSDAKITCSLTTATTPKHPENIEVETLINEDTINFRAKYHPQKLRDGAEPRVVQGGYEGATRVIVDGGEVKPTKQAFEILGARSIIMQTQLERYREDYWGWHKQRLQKSLYEQDADFDWLRDRHTKIHREMFGRVSLEIADAARAELSTEQLLADEEANRETIDLALLEKAFYSSRYLFMASCGKDYGPRLSGLFVGAWGAAWAGDYTCDSNVNLAVIGGNLVDLPECMEGYFAILERTMPQWRTAATKLYGCRGILGPVRIDGEYAVHHHVNDYHAHLTCTGLGPWLLYPMYEHWQITGDEEFLRRRLLPLLREQAEFYEDFLTRTTDDGTLIFVPANSPENGWLGLKPRTSASINSTMDIAAAKHALRMLMRAEKAVGEERSGKWQALIDKMPDYEVNAEGALREWAWPTAKENYGHRHLSHLYPVWPAYEINLDNAATAELVPAVIEAMQKRPRHIDQMHGTLQLMIGNIRVKRGERFEDLLKYFLENQYLYTSLATSHNSKHKIYNYDAILALQGMLVESVVFTDEGVLELLPALPPSLKQGTITGIKGRNRTTIEELTWDTENREMQVTLRSAIDQQLSLVHRDGIKALQTTVDVDSSDLGEQFRKLTLPAGEAVKLRVRW